MEIFISPVISLSWIVAMVIFMAREEIWGTLVSTAVAIGLFWWLTDSIGSLATIPWYVWIAFLTVYVSVGIGWLIFKWSRFSSKVYAELQNYLEEVRGHFMIRKPKELFKDPNLDLSDMNLIDLLEKNPNSKIRNYFEGLEREGGLIESIASITDIDRFFKDLSERWERKKREVVDLGEFGGTTPSLPLKASEFKDKIALYGMWWPFSLFWTFLSDFIIDFWRNVVEWVSGYLDSRSRKKYEKSFK